MALVEYDRGAPTEHGVYACRVRDDLCPHLLKDIFLLWYEGRWSYLGSDQWFRDDVLGFVGPLARKL